MDALLDFMMLKTVVWAMFGVFLIIFALTDGFDLGIGALYPFVARTDQERRIVLNTIGPLWEGQQVWFISAGTLLFAAWPVAYATFFSSFYWVLFLLLWTLFLRPVCFDYRSKIANVKWRTTWDWVLFVASIVPLIVFGAAFGNLLLGVPFHFSPFMQSFYTGTVLQQFHPFSVLCGIISLVMLVMHGGYYLSMRTDNAIASRARFMANVAAVLYVALFLLAGYFIAYHIAGYQLIKLSGSPHDTLIPLGKEVKKVVGAWMFNYDQYPLFRYVPMAAMAGALLSVLLSRVKQPVLAFMSSGVAVAGTIVTAGVSMYPFIFPSSSVPEHSLTIWDATAGHTSLATIVVVNVLVLPVIMIYVTYVYRKLSGKVTVDKIREEDKGLY